MFLRSPYDYYFGGSENGFQFEHNPNITVNNESSCSDVLTYDDWDDRYDYDMYITKHKINLFLGAILSSIMKIVWMLMDLSIMFH